MIWKGLQSSVMRIVVAATLFFTVGASHAGTIKKLEKSGNSLSVLQTRADLLGTPVKVAVDGGQVYVLTLRGWIFSLNRNTFGDVGFARLPGPLVTPEAPRIPATALAVTTTNVYAARFDNTTASSEIFGYDSALSSSSRKQTTVTGRVVDLTVDSNGSVYAASQVNGTTIRITKLDSSLSTAVPVSTTVPPGSSVTAIKAQTPASGVIAIYVALSDGTVYRLNTSLVIQASGTVTGTPVSISADSEGDIIVATSDVNVANSNELYKISPSIAAIGSQNLTGKNLVSADLDSSIVVAADYYTGIYLTNPQLDPAATPLSFSQPISIAIDASDATSPIYVLGGSPGLSEGDPHLMTIDGVRYDFQSAGEFVLLRHSRDSKAEASGANGASNSPQDTSEIQVRQFPVATTVNTCVSLNSAIAAQVGKHRVTYEPNLSGQPDPSGLQLRIDGKLTTLDPNGIRLSGGGRIVPTSAAGGIEIDFPNDDILFVTPGWWPSQGKWYLNVNAVPQQRAGGLIGDVPEGSWLPALPDGTSMGPAPTSPHERYVALYGRFADAWRVTDKTSLFDYAPGKSTKTFTTQNWPPETGSCSLPGDTPVRGTTEEVAIAACKHVPGDPANCIFDVKVTGLIDIANTYVASRNAKPVPETTQPKPRCCISWRIVALLAFLGLLGLLVLWMLLRRRHG